MLNFTIDMKKAREVYVNCTNADGSVLYGGFYHICGKIISGKSTWVPANPNHAYFDENKTLAITKEFRVFFEDRCSLLNDSFPLPAIQLEIISDIPWVLDEQNEYN